MHGRLLNNRFRSWGGHCCWKSVTFPPPWITAVSRTGIKSHSVSTTRCTCHWGSNQRLSGYPQRNHWYRVRSWVRSQMAYLSQARLRLKVPLAQEDKQKTGLVNVFLELGQVLQIVGVQEYPDAYKELGELSLDHVRLVLSCRPYMAQKQVPASAFAKLEHRCVPGLDEQEWLQSGTGTGHRFPNTLTLSAQACLKGQCSERCKYWSHHTHQHSLDRPAAPFAR
eukprot:2570585-Prymnesium_polylepis.2